MADELELSALEYAWSRVPADGGFALWMVERSLERAGTPLERLRPADALGSVALNGDPNATAEYAPME